MRTLRGRMTAWFFGALLLSLLAFAVSLYFELRRPSLIEIDDRVALETRLGLRWLEESYRVYGTLVRQDRRDTLVAPDSLRGPFDYSRSLNPATSSYFESFRDYVVLVDRSGAVLFASEPIRELGFTALQRLSQQVPASQDPVPPTTLDFQVQGGAVRYAVTPVRTAGEEIGALLLAAPMVGSFDPRVLARAMLAVSPLVILLAVLLAYWLSGNALKPVRGLMDEVDAIKDGRSLHRRLAVPLSNDEIARLALTVNGMLARLEQSFDGLHRFTADASHELKTPLMVLRAGVERALTHPGTPTEILATLDETLEELNQMNELVEDLLTLARADEGRAPLTLEATDLTALLLDVAETAGMLAEAGGVTVTTGVPAEPVVIAVEPSRIREMLLNLGTNAVKYTPAGGTVALELEDRDASVVIRVRDTGIGVAPGDLPHIFDRFWRADQARSRTGARPGVGLGLSITKWIAEAHGGSIAVQSRAGRGSIFTVVLPRTDVTPTAPAPSAPEPEPMKG
jgi:signal transduction histidine kinase